MHPLTGNSRFLRNLLGALLAGAAAPALAAQQAEPPHHEPLAAPPAATRRASDTLPLTNRARYQIPALRVDESPVIDGLLDEPTWARAALIDQFVQQEPVEGAAATERTEVRMMYDGATLLVGVRAFDSAADGVVATEMRRDGNRILEEDNIQLILDTFMDSRSAYMFVVSPLGAMLDQQIFEEGAGARGGSGGNVNRDWDGVWHAAARRTADGWTAEIAIPMVTLRFPDAAVQSWGVNVQRTIARKSEYVFWAPIPREYSITRVSLAGTLTDLESLDRGRDLRIKPYALAGGKSELDAGVTDRTTDQDVGLDVKYGISAGLNLDLTVNTDFAQAEADDERVNLTRFALLFPEKRDFFLENAGQFNVGAAQALSARIADLFFSRRIGISESGARAPILGGARLTGKLGRNNIAVMDIQTDDAFGESGQNFLVARYSRDFLERSRIGALAINKEGGSDGHYNRTFATDLIYAPNTNLTFNAFLAETKTPEMGGDDRGWYVRGAWLNQSLNAWVEHVDLGNDFNAEVGFVPRVGIRSSRIFLSPSPRPDVLGLRVLEPMFILTYTTDQTGRLVTRQRHYMMGFRFDNGAFLNFWHNQYFERLDDPFNVAAGITVPAGDYHFHDWRVSFNSNPSRRVTYSFSWDPQTFYGGDRTDLTFSTEVRVTSQIAATARFTRNDVALPAGSFVADVGAFQLDAALSPTISLRTLTQYNSLTEQWSTGARFRWSYRPGSDLYVVYDDVRRTFEDRPTPNEFKGQQLMVKMTYLFSL